MNRVRLNSELYNRPSMLLCHLLNDFFQAIMDWSHKHLFPSFGTEKKVIQHMMHRMLSMYVVFIHACILAHILYCCQQIVPTGTARFIPHLERWGLSREILVITDQSNYISKFPGSLATGPEPERGGDDPPPGATSRRRALLLFFFRPAHAILREN